MKGRKKGIVITVISLVILIVLYSVFSASAKKNKGQEVTLSKVARKDIVQSISTTGYIEANQSEEKTLASTQKVLKVYAKEGQDVAVGDVLAVLDNTDLNYQLQRAVVNQQLSDITSNSSLKQTQLDLNSAAVNLNEAQRKYDASKELYNGGYISLDEYKASEKTLLDAKNRVESLNNQIKNLSTSSSDSQRKKQNELSALEIQNLKNKIADSTIKATISGKIVKVNVEENQYPGPNSNQIVVSDISKLKVNVQLSQYDAVALKLGQNVTVKPKGMNREYSGTVTKIGQIAQIVNSGTDKETKVDVEITITNSDENVKIGYEVDASITLNEKKDALYVNYEAVKQDKDGKKYVFVVQNNTAVKKIIETGIETDFDIEVISGLNEGDSYISNPPDALKEGDKVSAAGGTLK